jgi:hypothetical protein
MQVVQHQHQRTLIRDRLDEIDHLLDHPELELPRRVSASARGILARQQPPDRGPAHVRRTGPKLERIDERPERADAFQRVPRAAQDRHSKIASGVGQAREQPRLPDPGLALDHHCLRRAAPDAIEQPREKFHLPLSSDQRSDVGRGHQLSIPYDPTRKPPRLPIMPASSK